MAPRHGSDITWLTDGGPLERIIGGQMRLVCPKCHALYEVDDSAIPPDGRDVQCSNCGHTWFQSPSGAAPDSGPDSGPDSARVSAPAPEESADGRDGAAGDADHGVDAADAPPETAPTSPAAEPAQDELPSDALEALKRALAAGEGEDTDGKNGEVAHDADSAKVQEAVKAAHEPDQPPAPQTPQTPPQAPETPTQDTDAEQTGDSAPPAPRRTSQVDPSVFEILKREAAREKALRAREHGADAPADTTPDSAPDTAPDSPDSASGQKTSDQPTPAGAARREPSAPRPSIAGEQDYARQAQSFREKLTQTREQAIQASQTPSPGPAPAPEADGSAETPPPEWPERVASPAADLPDFSAQQEELRASRPVPADGADMSADPAEATAARPRGRGRLGFYTAILIFVILLALYAFRGRLSGAFPAAAPWLDSYGAVIDQLRFLLATGAGAVLAGVRGLLSNLL